VSQSQAVGLSGGRGAQRHSPPHPYTAYGDLVGSSTSAVFTGHLSGTATIHAVSGSLATTDSGLITVTAGAQGSRATLNGFGSSVTSMLTAATFRDYAVTVSSDPG